MKKPRPNERLTLQDIDTMIVELAQEIENVAQARSAAWAGEALRQAGWVPGEIPPGMRNDDILTIHAWIRVNGTFLAALLAKAKRQRA